MINDGVDIRDDAEADIALETLLGSKYIRIRNADDGRRSGWPTCPGQRVIPHEECGADGLCVERTTTPEDLFDITREATERIDATDNERLNQLVEPAGQHHRGQARHGHRPHQRDPGRVHRHHRPRGQAGRLLDHSDELVRQPRGQGPDSSSG